MTRKSVNQLLPSLERRWKRTGERIMKILKDKKGIALFMAIAAMAVFLFFVSASLFLTRIDSKITSNFKLATQALEVADAGLNHALAMIASGYDFDDELACGTPPCVIVSNPSFPAGSGFQYTVSAENDDAEIKLGLTNDDENNVILLVSKAEGPANTTKTVKAYVRRSLAQFYPPSPVYVKGSSATSFDSYFFDNDDGIFIIGDDTNANDLLSNSDDTAGTAPSIPALTTTSATITNALLDELGAYSAPLPSHYIQSGGVNPSIETTIESIGVDAVADKFSSDPSAVKYNIAGLATVADSSSCPAAPTPCQVCASAGDCNFGTAAAPQITYIKDVSGSVSSLKGHFVGYGVLVLEGRVTLGENFKFKGLVIHKRSEPDHYLSIEDNSRIYGGLLLGPYKGAGAENDAVKFTIEDFSRIYYSSEALSMVDSNWSVLLPRPARVFGWLDK